MTYQSSLDNQSEELSILIAKDTTGIIEKNQLSKNC